MEVATTPRQRRVVQFGYFVEFAGASALQQAAKARCKPFEFIPSSSITQLLQSLNTSTSWNPASVLNLLT